MDPNKAITAIVPTSPLVCHPSTIIIDETYKQFRKHLSSAEFFILFDGVHPEEDYLRDRYAQYKHEVMKIDLFNVWGWKTDAWLHQSGMLKKILLDNDYVKTPLVFWSEHDIPLRDDFIDWQGIVDTLLDGEFGAIRFELTGDSPKSDEVRGRVNPHGVPIVMSTQYVNWPQVFRLDYLKEFVQAFGDWKTYLECPERDAWVKDNFRRYRYGIYSPEGDIRRCYHTSGREIGAPDLLKPYVEINGQRRYVYDKPYKPAEGV